MPTACFTHCLPTVFLPFYCLSTANQLSFCRLLTTLLLPSYGLSSARCCLFIVFQLSSYCIHLPTYGLLPTCCLHTAYCLPNTFPLPSNCLHTNFLVPSYWLSFAYLLPTRIYWLSIGFLLPSYWLPTVYISAYIVVNYLEKYGLDWQRRVHQF